MGQHLVAEADADQFLVKRITVAQKLGQWGDPGIVIINAPGAAGDDIGVTFIRRIRQLALDHLVAGELKAAAGALEETDVRHPPATRPS